MKKTAFIPCEYNPFHEGHSGQIALLRQRGFERIVSLMSGPFVQRGEPSVFPVAERARRAVEEGSDLVLMMPYAFCAQNARMFARGAVFTAISCGAGHLCFGAEDPDRTEDLVLAARLLEDEIIRGRILSGAKGNVPYPAVRIRVLSEETGKDMSFLEKPNNILALEYVRAILESKCSIEPVAVERIPGLPSASDIRKQLRSEAKVPVRTLDDYVSVLGYLISMGEKEKIESICGYFPGLYARMRNALPLLKQGLDSFVSEVNTATVTSSRVRRFLVNMMTGYTAEEQKICSVHVPGYIRVLSIGEKGADILKEISCERDIYIVTKPSDALRDRELCGTDRMMFCLDNRAFDLYSLPEKRTGDGLRYTPFVRKI